MSEVAVNHAAAAERRAMKISLRLDTIADNFEAVMPLIREALELGDHAALGYRSPGEYVADRFGNALSRLPAVLRRETVRELTDAGLSKRAIAPVVGVSHVMVTKDRQAIAGGNSVTTSAEPDYTTDEADLIVNHDTGEILDTPPSPKVTGLDGKNYTRPAPREPKAAPRRALPDQFFDAAYDLTKAVERIERLAEDDRFTQNAEKVAAKHRSDLLRAIDALQRVADRLDRV